MAARIPLAMHIELANERRVWCDKHLVSELEVDLLRLSDSGVGDFGTYRHCPKDGDDT
jgi:hypothetical protein